MTTKARSHEAHEAHEDKPLRRRNPKCIQLVGVVSGARTPDRVINPVVRIGRGSENGFPQTIPTHRGTEAQRLRECRVALGGAGGARDARDGARTGRSQAEQRHHAACDRRAARPIGPARWAGRHPLMSPSEHMRLRVSAPPRFVIRHRRAPWTGLWRHGSSVPRCLGVSWTARGADQRLTHEISWESIKRVRADRGVARDDAGCCDACPTRAAAAAQLP
jgi:hypothetical protein